MERILIERQFDGLAAACKRNIRVVAEHHLNIAGAVALAQDFHAGDADIRTVQDQRAAAEFRAVARDKVSGIAYRALRDIVCHKQCCGLIRVQVYCEVFALRADRRSNRCEFIRSRVGHGELYRCCQSRDDLVDIRFNGHVRSDLRECAYREFHRRNRFPVKNIEIIRAV